MSLVWGKRVTGRVSCWWARFPGPVVSGGGGAGGDVRHPLAEDGDCTGRRVGMVGEGDEPGPRIPPSGANDAIGIGANWE